MFQLIIHFLIFLFFLKVYKAFFYEWNYWYLFICFWFCYLLLSISIASSFFWNLYIKDIYLCILFIFSFLFLFNNFNLIIISLGKINGLNSESWWSFFYWYYQYIIWWYWQLFSSLSRSNLYYLNWYLKQKIFINFFFINFLVFIFCILIFLIYTAGGYVLNSNYFYYWECLINLVDYFVWENFLILIFIFINFIVVINLYFLSILLYLKNINYFGLNSTINYVRSTELFNQHIDFLKDHKYNNFFFKKLKFFKLYEKPFTWQGWQNFIVDVYYNKFIEISYVYWYYYIYHLYIYLGLFKLKGRRRAEYASGFNYKRLILRLTVVL